MEKSNNISESHEFSFTADNLRNAVWGTSCCTPLSSANHLISWKAQNAFYDANNTLIKKKLTKIAVENHLVEICYLLLFFFFLLLLLLNGRILISTNGYFSFLRYGVNKTPHTSGTFRRILLVCIKTVVCNSIIFVSIPVVFSLFSRVYPELQLLTEILSLSYFTLSLVACPDPNISKSSQLRYHLLLRYTVQRSQFFEIHCVLYQ